MEKSRFFWIFFLKLIKDGAMCKYLGTNWDWKCLHTCFTIWLKDRGWPPPNWKNLNITILILTRNGAVKLKIKRFCWETYLQELQTKNFHYFYTLVQIVIDCYKIYVCKELHLFWNILKADFDWTGTFERKTPTYNIQN